MKKRKTQLSMPLVYLVSLGCSKNLVDTETATASMLLEGFGIATDPEAAKVYYINTCAFIPPAREEAEDAIQTAVNWKRHSPRKRKLVISGCLVQWDTRKEYFEKYPDVDQWIGIDEVPRTGKLIAGLLERNPGKRKFLRTEKPEFMAGPETPKMALTPPHYAYVKIADGCENRCSYCSIPDIRGNLRCRDPEVIVDEAGNLLRQGAKELLIIAQDVTAYAWKNGAHVVELPELLRRIDAFTGDYWLRLLYTHPAHFSEELINTFNDTDHLLPYVDLPLQHISESVLKAMGRKISGAKIRKLLDKIRGNIPEMALRTTFITGFPGETGRDFEELRDFVREQQFHRLGIFQYYPEPGTPAAEMQNQVDPEISRERATELVEIQREISLKRNQKLVDQEINVIIDEVQEDKAFGRTWMDAPEIDNIVVLENVSEIEPGQRIGAVVTSAREYELHARILTLKL